MLKVDTNKKQFPYQNHMGYSIEQMVYRQKIKY